MPNYLDVGGDVDDGSDEYCNCNIGNDGDDDDVADDDDDDDDVDEDDDDVDEDDDDDEELHAQSLQAHILPSRVITSLQDTARCQTQI